MAVDLSKVKTIVIIDEDGKVSDRFELAMTSLVKDKIDGTRLELTKMKTKK